MSGDVEWPPSSAKAALLSSPSGRRKYQELGAAALRMSPLKRSNTTPCLLDRMRAARDDRDVLPEPVASEEEEDEETLQLKLAAIEAKLKLKKLQKSKEKEDTSDRYGSSRLSSAASALARNPLSPQKPRTEVPMSPSRRQQQPAEQKSPARVLLGIDKGVRGADVSLRRARTTTGVSQRSQDNGARNNALLTSRGSASGSARSTGAGKPLERPHVKSFGERMDEVREKERKQEKKRETVNVNRSTGFKFNHAELNSYRAAAEEIKARSPVRSPTKHTHQAVYSREEILAASNNSNAGNKVLKKSRTMPDLRQAPPRPTLERAESSSQGDASLYEGFSGLHLSSRILPHTFLKRTLPSESFTTFTIPDLLRDVKSPDYQVHESVADYVIVGVIASKSSPLDHKNDRDEQSAGKSDWERKWQDGTQNQKKFMVLTLTDLKWTIELYLFGTAVPRYHRLSPGTVVAVLNPGIMPPKKGREDTGAFSLTLHDGEDTVLEIGTARDLGYCNVMKKDGKLCGSWVDISKTEVCEWHLNNQLAKAQSSRMGVNTGTNGYGGEGTRNRNRSDVFDSRLRGDGEKVGLRPRNEGHRYDKYTGSHFYVASSNTGVASRMGSNRSTTGSVALDSDPFGAEGLSSRDKEARLQKRMAAQQKEREIARKLTGLGAGSAGAEYLRHKTDSANGGERSMTANEARSQHSALATKANIMSQHAGANENGKRAADSVRLSPIKKTRFVTAKGIREAGRESFGGRQNDDDNDDDDLDIV